MDKLISMVQRAPTARKGNDDDFCDRLSSRYTVVILITFAIFTLANQYISSPMTCWSPAHFEKGHVKFANNYCWIKNTYYLQWEKSVPTEWNTEKDRQMITYYQWIPFILIAQAILFYLPNMLWHALNSSAGVDCDDILQAAHSLSQKPGESRKTTLRLLTNQVDQFVNTQNDSKKFSCDCKSIVSATCCRICGKRLGNYLLLVFLLSKFFYIVNVIGQMFLLNVVLSTKYNTFGFDIVNEMAKNKTWFEGSYVAFPRVTLCDFEIRGQDMTNVQRYTIQCVLPMNLYNEKIYIFLWYWMVFVACASCVNLLLWLLRAIISRERKRFVKNHLSLGNAKFDDKALDKFLRKYLRQDGCLLLRLMAHNSDNITTTDIACSLFNKFAEQEAAKADNNKEIREDAARKLISGNKDNEKDAAMNFV